MASLSTDAVQDSINPCGSKKTQESEHTGGSSGDHDQGLETVDGRSQVAGSQGARIKPHRADVQKIIRGSNPPPGNCPQNFTHKLSTNRDSTAVDAHSTFERDLQEGIKLQHGQNSTTPISERPPSKRSVERAVKNRRTETTNKGAQQGDVVEQRPTRESRFHEDGRQVGLECSSEGDSISGGSQPNRASRNPQSKSLNSNDCQISTLFEANSTFSKLHKQLFSTQAGIGYVTDLPIRTKKISVMDPSDASQQSQPPAGNESTSVPPPPNESQAQPQQKKEKKAKPSKQASGPTALPLSPALIDLRVGHILRCIPHSNADSLYVSTIAMGDPEGADNTHKDEETGRIVRTVCSGLRGLIPIEQMQDRKVIVMANLKPVTMRGVKSAAMVLAASPPPKEGEDAHAADRVVELVAPPEDSEGGDRVYFEGWEYGEGTGPEKVLNPKKKQWESVQPGLFTSEELTVVFEAGRVQGVEGGKGELVVEGGKGKCKVQSLKGARLS